MAEAVLYQTGQAVSWVADGTYYAGDVIQLRDGRAGVILADAASGETVSAATSGVFTVAKTTSMVMLQSSKLFWDHSANKAHLLHVNDRDFYLGCCVEDATAAATTVRVNLNVEPKFTVGFENGYDSITILTAGLMVELAQCGSQGVRGRFDVTAEAQKVDALTTRGVAASTVAGEAIAHFLINVNLNGDNAAFDLNVGVANDTHATDADTIAESIFCHIDGNSTNINVESDDGVSTEVTATDTTLDFTAGTPFLFQIDMRNPAACLLYINGVRVCDGTTGTAKTFDVDSAAGPWKCLFHMEKSSDDSPGRVSVLYGGICTAQV